MATAPSRGSARAFRGAFGAVLASELLLLLRDRRAILLAVVLPTVLYPLVFLGQRWLERASRRALEGRTVLVACDLEDLPERERLLELLGNERPIEIRAADAQALRGIDASEVPSAAERASVADLSGGPGGVVLLAERTGANPPAALRLFYDGTNDAAQQARHRVDRAVDAFQRLRRSERAEELIGRDPARGLELAAVDVAAPGDAAGALLGRILPLLAVVVVLSGGSYAALSVFAGEREAGTLETLLVQPAPATAVVAAKFGAVLCTGLLTLALNGGSLLLCLRAGLGGLPGAARGAAGLAGLDAGRLLLGVVAFLPAAVLLCALLCMVCGRARTFREGQHTLLPLLLVCLVPTALASQEIDLDWLLATVPLAGPSLALRDALRGSLRVPLALWMFAASSLWAWAALGQLARTLGTERLVHSDDSQEEVALRSVQSRFALRWAWVAIFLAYVVGGTLQAWNLPWGIFLTLWILLLPLAWLSARGTARRARESPARALHLSPPRVSHALGAVLLAPALAVLAKIVFDWQRLVLPLPSRIEEAGLLEGLLDAPLPLSLFLLAVSPAICEEILFRGALLSGLRRDLGPARCLAWEAVLFGAAHGSIYRFVPTAILGMVLAAITLRTKSLFPAILLHATYNALLLRGSPAPDLAWLALPGILLLAGPRPRPQTTA